MRVCICMDMLLVIINFVRSWLFSGSQYAGGADDNLVMRL